jgi:hypothetical protein
LQADIKVLSSFYRFQDLFPQKDNKNVTISADIFYITQQGTIPRGKYEILIGSYCIPISNGLQ